MASQDGINGDSSFNDINICTPLENVSTYEVSRGSLPGLFKVSKKHTQDDSFINQEAVDHSDQLNELDVQQVLLPDSVLKKKSHLFINETGKHANQKAKIKNVTDLECYNKLEDDNHDLNWEIITPSDIDAKDNKNGDKSMNNSIKIKLNFNSDQLSKRKQLFKAPPNCTLEIELNGNKQNTLKVANNKTTQANSKRKSNELNAKEQVMNFQNLEQQNIYTSSVNKVSLQDDTEPTLILQQHLLECPSYSQTSSSSANPNETFHSVSESYMKDESIQTSKKKNMEETDFEDSDMDKLKMWLEMLNNSEYNSYNQNLGRSLVNDNLKKAEYSVSENERDFQSFLEELHENDSICRNLGVYKIENDSKRNSSKRSFEHSSARSRTEQTVRNRVEENKINHAVLRENIKKMVGSSVESNYLNENDPCSACEREISRRNWAHRKKKKRQKYRRTVTDPDISSHEDSSFIKAVQNLIMRLVPSQSIPKKVRYKGSDQGIYSLNTVQERDSESLWEKMNPFKYCFLRNRDKPYDTIIANERSRSGRLSNVSQFNNVKYCYSQLTNCADCNGLTRVPDRIESYCSICNGNNYCNGGYPTYFSNAYGSQYSTQNYPYEKIPVMQCPGGCRLCNPELNIGQN